MKLSFWPFKRQQKSFDLDAAVAKAETAPVGAGKPVLIEGSLTANDVQKLREAFQDRQSEITIQVDPEALTAKAVIGGQVVKEIRTSGVHFAPKPEELDQLATLAKERQSLEPLSKAGITFTESQKQRFQAMKDTGDVAGAQALIRDELEREFGSNGKNAVPAAPPKPAPAKAKPAAKPVPPRQPTPQKRSARKGK